MLMSCFSVCLAGKLCCLLEREKGFIKQKPDRKRELLCVFKFQVCFWDCLCCTSQAALRAQLRDISGCSSGSGCAFPQRVCLTLTLLVFNNCFYPTQDCAAQGIPVFSQNNSGDWSLSVSIPCCPELDAVFSPTQCSWNFIGLFISLIFSHSISDIYLWYYHIFKLSL